MNDRNTARKGERRAVARAKRVRAWVMVEDRSPEVTTRDGDLDAPVPFAVSEREAPP